MATVPTPTGLGRLIVFLGAAAGVGKTYAMLGEARLAVEDGVDLVIGYLEPHGRRATEERARGLARAPVVEMGPGGRAGTEMDVRWLLERRPSVVVADELAHTYAIGDPPRRRYEDVAELRRAGIEVWTTLNVQHMESLNDRVARLTGTRVRETVPDQLVHGADEVRLVDLSPTALRERLARGLVYPAGRVEQAMAGFFQLRILAALRAMVLHELAEAAAAQVEVLSGSRPGDVAERVLCVVEAGPGDGPALVRESARMARRLDGDLIVLLVDGSRRGLSADARRGLGESEAVALSLGGTVLRRQAEDVADLVADEAGAVAATRLVLAASAARGGFRRRPVAERVLARIDAVDVTVVAVPRIVRGDDAGDAARA